MIPREVQIGTIAAWIGLSALALLAPSALPGDGALLYLLLPLVVGFLVGRWPAVALALVPALLSIPLGREDGAIPFLELLIDTVPFLVVPILLGIALNKGIAFAFARRREPSAA